MGNTFPIRFGPTCMHTGSNPIPLTFSKTVLPINKGGTGIITNMSFNPPLWNFFPFNIAHKQRIKKEAARVCLLEADQMRVEKLKRSDEVIKAWKYVGVTTFGLREFAIRTNPLIKDVIATRGDEVRHYDYDAFHESGQFIPKYCQTVTFR